jgi:hypothetical protein
VPVLARWIESAGIPTVVVTMMPALAEERRAPRIVGVEFPFGHPFGMPHDRAMQRSVLELALRVLAGARDAGTRVDLDTEWPVSLREAYRAWQPKEPSPIVKKMLSLSRAAGEGQGEGPRGSRASGPA